MGYYSEWQFPFQGKTCAIFQSKNPHAPFKMKKLKLTNNSIMSSNSDKSLKNELVNGTEADRLNWLCSFLTSSPTLN